MNGETIIMDWLQEFKELHYKELELKKELDSRITIGITLLTILGSAQILLWTRLKDLPLTIYTIVYIILCLITTTLFGICIYKFYRVHAGYVYNRFPIKKLYPNYVYLSTKINPENYQDVLKMINKDMVQRFAEDAIHNRKNNKQRIKRQGKFIYATLFALLITFITFGYSTGIDIYETYKEEVSHMIEDKRSLNTDSNAMLDKDGKPVNLIPLTPEPSSEIFTLGGFGARKAAEETDKNDRH